MKFELPPLPYSQDALSPHISAETLSIHYGKHHQAYLDKLKSLLEGKPEAEKSLEEIVIASEGAIFNNAAQVWNHSFYWQSLKPKGGGQPTGKIAARIEAELGGYAKFRTDLAAAAVNRFGSGWAWLVDNKGKLEITSTSNAESPLKSGQKALLTIDVWEHAYYVDYRNLRAKYVDTVIDHLLNWDHANSLL